MNQNRRRLPGLSLVTRSTLWQSYRHRIALRTGPRENSTFTGFCRLPTQFEALVGPVLDQLSDHTPARLRIASVGCSYGAEAYTLASFLLDRHPQLEFEIVGCDLDPDIVEKAKAATFDPERDVLNNRHLPDGFLERTFDRADDALVVKPAIRSRVSFRVVDVLDADALASVGTMDLVLAQNFLFHLDPALAERAFRNIVKLLAERSALVVDGTDIPMRMRLTREYGLEPLDYKIEEIHDQARWARAVGYPYDYWGLEPFSRFRWDWKRRYATIFLKRPS